METVDAAVLSTMLSRHADDPTEHEHALRADPAELVLAVLTSSTYRKGSLARAELDRHRTTMLHTIRQRTAKGEPVLMTLMAFPFKVPNPAKVGRRTLPDLAELAALLRLARLQRAVAAVYEPGIQIELILDGRSLAPVVGIADEEVSGYERYLGDLAVICGVDRFVRQHDFEELLADGPAVADLLPGYRRAAQAWWERQRGSAEWLLAFRRMLGMVSLRELDVDEAQRVMAEASHGRLDAAHRAIEERVWRAMVDYRAFDLVVHELDPRPRRFPQAIHATTQERPGRLSIWLIRRGRSHLPWHGVGVLDEHDRATVVPYAEIAQDGTVRGVHLSTEDTPFLYRRDA